MDSDQKNKSLGFYVKNEDVNLKMQTMRAIETPWAMTALWQMAEHLPVVLVEMAKEEPKELLRDIEHKVEMALSWKETVITDKIMTEDQALEFMPQLLEPNYCPPKPAKLKITEKMMQDIVHILMTEA